MLAAAIGGKELEEYQRQYHFHCVLPPKTANSNFSLIPLPENPASLLTRVAQSKPLIIDTIGGTFLARNAFPEAAIISFTDDYYAETKRRKSETIPAARSTLDVFETFHSKKLPIASQNLAFTLWKTISERGEIKPNAAAILDNITLVGYCRHTLITTHAIYGFQYILTEAFKHHGDSPEIATQRAHDLLMHLHIINFSPFQEPLLDHAGNLRSLDILADNDSRFHVFSQSPAVYLHYIKEFKQELTHSSALNSRSTGAVILKTHGLPPETVILKGKPHKLRLGFHDMAYYLHELEKQQPVLFADLEKRTASGLSTEELYDYLSQCLRTTQPHIMAQRQRPTDSTSLGL